MAFILKRNALAFVVTAVALLLRSLPRAETSFYKD